MDSIDAFTDRITPGALRAIHMTGNILIQQSIDLTDRAVIANKQRASNAQIDRNR